MSVFVHAQGIKTVHKKWQNSVYVVVECYLKSFSHCNFGHWAFSKKIVIYLTTSFLGAITTKSKHSSVSQDGFNLIANLAP